MNTYVVVKLCCTTIYIVVFLTIRTDRTYRSFYVTVYKMAVDGLIILSWRRELRFWYSVIFFDVAKGNAQLGSYTVGILRSMDISPVSELYVFGLESRRNPFFL